MRDLSLEHKMPPDENAHSGSILAGGTVSKSCMHAAYTITLLNAAKTKHLYGKV